MANRFQLIRLGGGGGFFFNSQIQRVIFLNQKGLPIIIDLIGDIGNISWIFQPGSYRSVRSNKRLSQWQFCGGLGMCCAGRGQAWEFGLHKLLVPRCLFVHGLPVCVVGREFKC